MDHLQHFLFTLNFLDWWLLATVLALADVFMSRTRLLPPAAAAGFTGFLLLLSPQLSWGVQVACFALVAVAMQLAYRWKPGRREMAMANFYDFSVKTIGGKPKSLKDYSGHPVLVVNVASECGLTPQYAGLEKLYQEYKDRGFVVLGLPCNQFGAQEPGSEAEIQQFCQANYGIDFPLTSKIEVNGPGADPLYKWLRSESGGADIQWNFEKFLIGKDGRIIQRYSPKTVPEDKQLKSDIQRAL